MGLCWPPRALFPVEPSRGAGIHHSHVHRGHLWLVLGACCGYWACNLLCCMVFWLLFRRVSRRVVPELLLLWPLVPGRDGKVCEESFWRAGFRAKVQESTPHPDDRVDCHLLLSSNYLDTCMDILAESLDSFFMVQLGNASNLVWCILLWIDLAIFLDTHSIIVPWLCTPGHLQPAESLFFLETPGLILMEYRGHDICVDG
jgi:hypothetical protein